MPVTTKEQERCWHYERVKSSPSSSVACRTATDVQRSPTIGFNRGARDGIGRRRLQTLCWAVPGLADDTAMLPSVCVTSPQTMPALISDGWNHNVHYHERLLRSVPQPCRRALDVGCGLGAFARRLSSLADQVDALDSDAAVIRQARERSAPARNVRFMEADFIAWEPDEPYDFISMIAVLHHLPFGDALTKAAHLLRSGGVLVVLGLDRTASLFDAGARSLIAYPVSGYYRVVRATSPVGARTVEPTMTLPEIRRQAAGLLPGATVRRHLLWRYSLVWTKL